MDAGSGTIFQVPTDAMSLKAKLEAVIYAAEEPVTLAQLAALFVEDVLEWKTEQAAAAAEAAAEASRPGPGEVLPLLNGDQIAELPAEPEVEPEAALTEGASEATPDDVPAATAEEAAPQEAAAEGEAEPQGEPAAEVDAEAEAKRLAKQQDREIRAILRQQLDELIAEYASDARGIEIREIAGGYRMATKPECHDAVRMFVKSLKPALKLSLPALETLAVIAYKQPITAPEVNEIRGVDSSGVFGSLLARKLIATAGRKQVIGRPILYKTTKEFLLRFGLKDVSELPSMEEFEKMAALELEEPEPTEADQAAAVAEAESLADQQAESSGDAEAETEPAAAPAEAEDPTGEAEVTEEGNAGDQTAPASAEAETEAPPAE